MISTHRVNDQPCEETFCQYILVCETTKPTVITEIYISFDLHILRLSFLEPKILDLFVLKMSEDDLYYLQT